MGKQSVTVRDMLFAGSMVRAIFDGKKTQTRRVLSQLQRFGVVSEFGPSDTRGYDWHFRDKRLLWNDLTHSELLKVLPFQVGDLVWVREAWRTWGQYNDVAPRDLCAGTWVSYEASKNPIIGADVGKLRPSMFMPRWASRLTLKVTDVRVQRLQEISAEDAIYEGVTPGYFGEDMNHHRAGFKHLWNSLNEKRGYGWEANPWVVAVSIDRIEANVDTVLKRVAA